jgi:hypothetical protein
LISPALERHHLASKEGRLADYPAKHLAPADMPDAAAVVLISTAGQSSSRALPIGGQGCRGAIINVRSDPLTKGDVVEVLQPSLEAGSA